MLQQAGLGGVGLRLSGRHEFGDCLFLSFRCTELKGEGLVRGLMKIAQPKSKIASHFLGRLLPVTFWVSKSQE